MKFFKPDHVSMNLLGCALLAQSALAEHAELPEITVSGQQQDGFNSSLYNPDVTPFTSPDAASALGRIPGGSLNYNGQVSGQIQYRGMFGPRMNTRINGMYINSGGPNWMDPPLHYLPGALVENVEVTRGIAPVSSGSGIGGYVEARTKSSHFSNTNNFSSSGDLFLGGHSVDGGADASALFATSNNEHRVHLLGSFEHGDDFEFGDGEVSGTEYRRSFVGFGYGHKTGVHEFSIDGWKVNTGPNGTPALPLDIDFFDSGFVKSSFSTQLGGFAIEARASASNIEHRMNNFVLRPTPDFSALPLPPFVGTDRRSINATGDGFGYGLDATTALFNGQLKFGVDGHLAQHSATVSDPDFAPFFINNFNDAEFNRHGFFAEWRNDPDKRLGAEIGVRVEVVNTDAGFVNAFPAVLADTGAVVNGVTVGAQTLRNNFNNADRSQTDTNIDAVFKLDYELNKNLLVEAGFARKVRSPSYVERYLWIPLEVNAGLGDGNNYIGDPDLDPETSHQIELGFQFQMHGFSLRPRAYYRHIDDYIQGIATTNASAITFSTLAAGDPTPLIFSNVDAEIYGFDTDFSYMINRQWQLYGLVSYTRGKRRDVDDDLFRIAPLNGRLGVNYSRPDWGATIETVMFAEQHDIADSITFDPANPNNNNESTAGYALLNLYGNYSFPVDGLRMNLGIENVLDEDYSNHLSGFNRNSGSDVAIGQRLPGPGRNVFASLNYVW